MSKGLSMGLKPGLYASKFPLGPLSLHYPFLTPKLVGQMFEEHTQGVEFKTPGTCRYKERLKKPGSRTAGVKGRPPTLPACGVLAGLNLSKAWFLGMGPPFLVVFQAHCRHKGPRRNHESSWNVLPIISWISHESFEKPGGRDDLGHCIDGETEARQCSVTYLKILSSWKTEWNLGLTSLCLIFSQQTREGSGASLGFAWGLRFPIIQLISCPRWRASSQLVLLSPWCLLEFVGSKSLEREEKPPPCTLPLWESGV